MQGLSVVIITYNEERNIGSCLEAVREIADEIIVLDSFSTDKTPTICQQYNVQFHQRDWEGYAKSKNYANSLARYSHILSLDADEVPSPELLQALQAAPLEPGIAYAFNRLTQYVDHWVRHCGWYPDRKTRVFPKGKAQWEGNFVHETLVLNAELETRVLPGDLLHYSIRDRQDHLDRIEKYARLNAEKAFSRGKRANLIKGYASATIRLLNMFILKQGFRDGRVGWDICRLSAYARVRKEQQLKDLCDA